MITVKLNRRDFEYDIYSLVRAFYPKSDCVVSDRAEDLPAQAELKMSLFFEQNRIRLEISGEDGFADQSGELPLEENMERPDVKSVLKSLIYGLLGERTGQDLPWGDLTGIRPVKIAMSQLLQGKSNAQIARYMRERYHVSIPKSALAVMIANKEKYLLDQLDHRNGYSLYIGIPFCPSICLYCSFSSSPLALWKGEVDAYLDALEKEMGHSACLFEGKELQTVYIGGGTPTTLEPAQMDRLLTMTERCFDLSKVREFTVEAGRPDSITEDKLKVLRQHGISRISINPQTMNQKTLDLIGRKHTVEEIIATFRMARELGFDNINMDLIIGLPGEGLEEVRHTMEELGKLDPDSVTVHALALKRAARLTRLFDDYKDISFQASNEIMDLTMRTNEERGLAPYYLYRQKNIAGNFENVGYAKAGRECLYNILIMEEVQSILALGAGGSTKLVYADGHIERIENVKDIRSYIDRIDEMIDRKSAIKEIDMAGIL